MAEQLTEWLFDLEGFQKQYQPLLVRSLAQQFPALQSDISYNLFGLNSGYLINCASILASSSKTQCIEAALRICQYFLSAETSSESLKLSAAVILNRMANAPSINLAMENGFIAKDIQEKMSFTNRLAWEKKRIQHTIYMNEGKQIIANPFQIEAWDSLNENICTVLSAPTSVGKSHIILSWLVHNLEPGKSFVYLVPTRALVSQVAQDIHQAIADLGTSIDYNLITIPTSLPQSVAKCNICVFTQERLHYFLSRQGRRFKINTLTVDEAHKIGEAHRGILLQQAVERIFKDNSPEHIIYATPSATNPKELANDLPSKISRKIVDSDTITVNQNLFWVSESSNTAKNWKLDYWYNNSLIPVGVFKIQNQPASDRKRLTFIAYELGKHTNNNLIYVNGAADAEEAALLLKSAVNEEVDDDELIELAKLSKRSVHKDYRLAQVINSGIAFHYGNMPLVLRSEIERLFKSGKIKFLICTSTLIEGVNLPCKIFFAELLKKAQNFL